MITRRLEEILDIEEQLPPEMKESLQNSQIAYTKGFAEYQRRLRQIGIPQQSGLLFMSGMTLESKKPFFMYAAYDHSVPGDDERVIQEMGDQFVGPYIVGIRSPEKLSAFIVNLPDYVKEPELSDSSTMVEVVTS